MRRSVKCHGGERFVPRLQEALRRQFQLTCDGDRLAKDLEGAEALADPPAQAVGAGLGDQRIE